MVFGEDVRDKSEFQTMRALLTDHGVLAGVVRGRFPLHDGTGRQLWRGASLQHAIVSLTSSPSGQC